MSDSGRWAKTPKLLSRQACRQSNAVHGLTMRKISTFSQATFYLFSKTFLFSCCFLAALASCDAVFAQFEIKDPSPEAKLNHVDFGSGTVTQSPGHSVEVRNEWGDRVIAKSYALIGERLVVLLPTGELSVVDPKDVRLTSTPFRPASRREILDELQQYDRFKRWKFAQSKNHLFLYHCSGNFVAKVAKILETIHMGVSEHLVRKGFQLKPDPFPLVVLIFPTQKEFQEFSGSPDGIGAYYNTITNHVVLFEKSNISDDAPIFAYDQVLSTVAHEGVHQTLHNLGIQRRMSRWPMWLSEGLPEYFAPTTKGRDVIWKGVGQVNDFRMSQLAGLVHSQVASANNLIPEILTRPAIDSTGYALSWGLVHYLADAHPDAFWEYVKEISKRQPFERGALELQAEDIENDVELFGENIDTSLTQLHMGMVEHLRSLRYRDPAQDETHYLLLLQYIEGKRQRRFAGITLSRDSIAEWKAEHIADLTSEQLKSASFRIIEFETKALAERYGARWMAGDNRRVLH
ncbi:Hypothetical protein PBC10988_41320 [Planctomycetales bacterium 10988]|nr:Hypothetical protein PBC10988_41320 [Planctomycetales bacterium 10988]